MNFKQMTSLTVLAAAAMLSMNAQAIDASGFAFTAFNADEDGISFVALSDIGASTAITFTDNNWNGTGFTATEGFFTWNSGSSTVAAGTVVRLLKMDVAARSASVGTVAATGSFNISSSADVVYAFTGTAAVPSFLAAIANTPLTATLLSNTGLTVGNGAVQLTTSSDNAEYTGVRTGQATFSGYKALVNNSGNWLIQGDVSAATYTPNTTAFAVTAVPEPSTYALLLAGLGAVGFVARRRKV